RRQSQHPVLRVRLHRESEPGTDRPATVRRDVREIKLDLAPRRGNVPALFEPGLLRSHASGRKCVGDERCYGCRKGNELRNRRIALAIALWGVYEPGRHLAKGLRRGFMWPDSPYPQTPKSLIVESVRTT